MKGMAGAAGLLKVKALAKEADKATQGLLTGGVNADSLKGVGNTRIQATIGTQKSQSNSSSDTEVNQASNITTNNLALIATGAGVDSNINVNGSNLNVTNDALFKADNDFNLNGVAQNSNTRSTNKSSSTAIGGYADTSGSGGITASASKGKGYANSDSVTYANTQVNVGGTTTFDIANDVNGKGVVFNTDKVQGVIRGNVNMESPQDTYTYDSNQKSAGFNLDVDLVGNGKGSSLSVNGAKTNITADSKIVGQQTGIFANEADLIVEGTGNFKGAVFTTSEAAQANGKSNIVFKQGVTATDIVNTTSYEGDAISVGLSVGKTANKPQATMNGLGYGTDGDSNSSITKGGVSGYNDPQGILTTDNREALAGKLESVFDAARVNEELGAQTQITKEFGKEAPKAVGDFANNRIKAIRADTTLSNAEKNAAIAKWDEGGVYRVAAHTALGALGTGSIEGALTTGGVAAAAPTLNNLQDKIAESLIASGMSESIAKGTASGVVSLALLGAGSAAGLDTSSTVTATNVDANNRQLHPDQIKFLKLHAEDYAKEKGITKKEALKILARAAVYNLDKGWYDAYNTYLSLDEIKQFDDANKFLEERNGHHVYNTALVESYNRINNPDGIEPNIADTSVLMGPFRNENPESYTDSRMYLKEMLSDADSVQFALENLALQDPRTYGRTPETAFEVQNAKAEGANQGFSNVATAPVSFIQGLKQGMTNLFTNPEETVKGAFNSTVETVKAIPKIPEELSYKGYEDDLAIMQGRGLEVNRNNAQGSTELGIGIGLGSVGASSIKKLGKFDAPNGTKADINNIDIPVPASPETINTLLEQLKNNAQGKNKNVAYSQGVVGDKIIEASDFDNFTKDDLRNGLGRPKNGSAKWHTFPGVEDGGNGRLVITDPETYIESLEAIYGAKEEVLNDRTKQLIIDSVSRNNTYSAMNGLPGTHAEVRTYNMITSDYPNIADSQISIATVRGGEKNNVGADFPACTNCNSILPDEVNIPTGRVPIQSVGTPKDIDRLYIREE